MTDTEPTPEMGANVTPGVVARTAEFIGQATAVEQARAVAEVQAAIVVAQQCPRNMTTAVAAMRESCAQPALADRAFFRFPRAKTTVSGPSVHLARELARCFGNVQYGIAELRRDDQAGESEMMAFAWDVQMNTRASNVFVVPHRRDTTQGVKALTDMRDIYENNANMGARRLREAIFAILPTWFTEEAKAICNDTITNPKNGKPLPQRVADAIERFEALGVTADQLDRKIGRHAGKWTAHDVAQLGVVYASLNRGEVTVEEEFPPVRVTGEQIDEKANRPRAARMMTRPQQSKMMAGFGELNLTDRDDRIAFTAEVIGRDIASSSELTADEAKVVIDTIERRVAERGESS